MSYFAIFRTPVTHKGKPDFESGAFKPLSNLKFADGKR